MSFIYIKKYFVFVIDSFQAVRLPIAKKLLLFALQYRCDIQVFTDLYISSDSDSEKKCALDQAFRESLYKQIVSIY